MASGQELAELWTDRVNCRERDVLFVVSKGFDPRMCLGIDTFRQIGGKGKRDIVVIGFDEGPASPSAAHANWVATNWTNLQGVAQGWATVREHKIRMKSERRRIGSRSAATIFNSLNDLKPYTDVIVDISAMPRGIYFPLLAKIMYLLDQAPPSPKAINLHVWVAEDPVLDQSIQDQGVEDTASYIHGFHGGLEMEATADQPRVWIPLLGEGQAPQLQRIYDLVTPDEICPVLPHPSLNPRRGDDLVREYRSLLFDQLQIEPRNFIYASERNPFEVYRQLMRTILHYRVALEPVGGCKAVLSALSTKLMSLGALLTAHDLKQHKIDIAIAQVESHGHTMTNDAKGWRPAQSELFGLWLSGECYDTQPV